MAAPDMPMRCAQFSGGQRRSRGLGHHDVQQGAKVVGGDVMQAGEDPADLVRLRRQRPHVGGDERLQGGPFAGVLEFGHRPSISPDTFI